MAKKQSKKNPSEQPSFEEALGRLEGIVHSLEEGVIGLNEALALYEEGVKLLRQSFDLLERAERKIELLSGVDAEGDPIVQSFDDQGSLSLDEKAQRRSRRRSASQRPPEDVSEEPPAGDIGMDAPPGLF